MNATAFQLSDSEFRAIRDLVQARFAICLTDQKRSLITGRLSGLLRKLNLSTFKDFYKLVVEDRSGETLGQLIDRISTNHTFFYRESEHFEFFSEFFVKSMLKSDRTFQETPRIWDAGCSSGEEPYTLAMLLAEASPTILGASTPLILATDISAQALNKATTACYSTENVQRLPAILKKKYLHPNGEGMLKVDPDIQKLVLYRRLNLTRDSFPFKSQFHTIFCRNVMIYFEPEFRLKLVSQFIDWLVPGGYLFIGHSESLGRAVPNLKYIKPAVYRKVD